MQLDRRNPWRFSAFQGGRVALGQSDGESRQRPPRRAEGATAGPSGAVRRPLSASRQRTRPAPRAACRRTEFGAAFPGRRTKPVDGERPPGLDLARRRRRRGRPPFNPERRPPKGACRQTAGHSGWTPRLPFGRWLGWEPSFRLAAKTWGSINAYKGSRLPGAGAELIRRHRQCGDLFGPLVLGVMRLSHPVLTLPSLRSQHGHPMPRKRGSSVTFSVSVIVLFGERGGNRTHDPLIKSLRSCGRRRVHPIAPDGG
jgi:hypothetical protein